VNSPKPKWRERKPLSYSTLDSGMGDMKQLFNDGWKFTKKELFIEPESLDNETIMWQEVDLPHDWLIYNTSDLYETGEGWYKKTFYVEDTQAMNYFIYFEGVYMDSTIFINNVAVGEWKYGYSSFEFDITKYLKPEENEIKVRVVYQNLNTRWYSGAGIYRNVWLKTTEAAHFITDGIYISANRLRDSFLVEIEAEIIDEAGNSKGTLCNRVYNRDGQEVALALSEIQLTKNEDVYKQEVTIQTPLLWNLSDPYLYELKTELLVEGRIVDTICQKFGLRTLKFDSNKGFFLNDTHVKLYGVCEHHDLGALGAAFNKAAMARKFTILKEMGVNAIRTSHNMPSIEFMELADEMGLLVVSEAFDMWERPKTEYDYARFFKEWCEKDVASWVRRDRNHPSLIMWSIGNEIYDTHADERGLEITKMLRDMVYRHDPKTNGYVTIGSNYMSGENAQRCAEELPVAGYNYAERLYEEHHKKYPHWVIYGSETASTIQSRGIYHFPASKVVVTHEDEQCSSLGNCSTSWGAPTSQKNIIDDRDTHYSLGQFIWTGFDYIGEPTPYFTKNSYFGQVDTAGFKKDAFYIYQAEWTDYKVAPMVHILPYWDFNKGQLIDIRVYSNAPKVELYFNEKSLGVYEIDHKNGKQLSGEWQIPYETGTIKAVAYDENQRIIATDIRSSFGDAKKLMLKADKNTLKADGQDMIFVEISAEDENGNPVANANNRVEVCVTGAGRLVGLDNGDSTDYDSYKGTSRRLFSGKLLAMIAAKQEAGNITLSVSSKGLNTEKITLCAKPSDIIPGISARMENIPSEEISEIPIRKIELINAGTNQLDVKNSTVVVSAGIYPDNATYEELEWKAVTLNGIVTNNAVVQAKDRKAVVTAKGDGEFRLRCTAKNGGKNPQIISELEFSVSGLGAATLNPYQFISGGLYNSGNREFHSGLLGGIATEAGENRISFKGLDFGSYGSDELSMPIYFLSNEPAPLQIWEGIPGEEGAQLLLDTVYHKNYIWNTYQEETFKLTKRLTQVTTLSICVRNKLDIKGFSFTHYEKAYARLSIKAYTTLYGDTYTEQSDSIEKIGNNVSIEFDEMDFSEKGCQRLILCGRSRNDKNTLQIQFSGAEGQHRQSIELPYSKEYREYEFNLEPVMGVQKVNFMFLPGSNFDFKWFQFQKGER
jgi:beta-galactosidase